MASAHRSFLKKFESLCRSRSRWTVFEDFLVAASCSLSNSVERFLERGEQHEREYMKIAGKYGGEDIRTMSELLGLVAMSVVENEFDDFLGPIFHELELHSHWHGQFFTPSHVAHAMAGMLMDDVASKIAEKGFVTIAEPACGAGVMVLAACKVIMAAGLDYRRVVHVTAKDLSRTAALMCYVQLCVRGIPAVVIVGDTLAQTEHEVWYTPAHHRGRWIARIEEASCAKCESTT